MHPSLSWIERLVAFDTVSAHSNLDLIDAARRLADTLGVVSRQFDHPSQPKANLWITVPDAVGRTDGGVVLSGHTDVVPVEGQQWSSPPFEATVRDGRLYGRGTADMKGFIGIALTWLPKFAAARLTEPLHIALSYDEEVGCIGAPPMVDAIASAGALPRLCIVGEPTGMRVVTGHKSIAVVRVHLRGRAAHSSLTDAGVNAIEYAADVVALIRDVATRFRIEGPFDVAYPLAYSTAGVNLIEGGIAVNTIPDSCTVTFDVRTIGTVPIDDVLASIESELAHVHTAMRARHPEAGLTVERVAAAPGLAGDGNAAAAEFCVSLGADASDVKVTFGTEAGLFERAGIPTVVCGPGHIDDAHRADESIELTQIQRGEAMIDNLLSRLTAS